MNMGELFMGRKAKIQNQTENNKNKKYSELAQMFLGQEDRQSSSKMNHREYGSSFKQNTSFMR